MINICTTFVGRHRVFPYWAAALRSALVNLADETVEEVRLYWLDQDASGRTERLLRQLREDLPVNADVTYEQEFSLPTFPKRAGQSPGNRAEVIARANQVLLDMAPAGEDVVMWEDDIVAPANGPWRLLQVGSDPQAWIVGATQYPRARTPHYLLAWHWNEFPVWDTEPLGEVRWELEPLKPRHEMPRGVLEIGAVAWGLVYVAGEFRNAHRLRAEGTRGHDVMAAWDTIYTSGRRVLLDWATKCPHLEEQVTVHKSEQCKTDVREWQK